MNSYTCFIQQATWGIKTSLGTKKWTNHPCWSWFVWALAKQAGPS